MSYIIRVNTLPGSYSLVSVILILRRSFTAAFQAHTLVFMCGIYLQWMEALAHQIWTVGNCYREEHLHTEKAQAFFTYSFNILIFLRVQRVGIVFVTKPSFLLSDVDVRYNALPCCFSGYFWQNVIYSWYKSNYVFYSVWSRITN